MIKEREVTNSPTPRPVALLGENVPWKEETSLVPVGRNKQAEGGKPPAKRGGRYAIEREIHRKALAFYFSLGPSRTLAQVAKNFDVKYEKQLTTSGYNVDHSAGTFLIDPAGRVRLLAPYGQRAEWLAEDIRLLLAGV